MSKICLTVKDIEHALDVYNKLKQCDATMSDTIEIIAIKQTDLHNKSDKVHFFAQSIYGECNSHHLTRN